MFYIINKFADVRADICTGTDSKDDKQNQYRNTYANHNTLCFFIHKAAPLNQKVSKIFSKSSVFPAEEILQVGERAGELGNIQIRPYIYGGFQRNGPTVVDFVEQGRDVREIHLALTRMQNGTESGKIPVSPAEIADVYVLNAARDALV